MVNTNDLRITWGRLGDIFETTWGQLRNNLGVTWGQLGDVLRTTWEQLGDDIGTQGERIGDDNKWIHCSTKNLEKLRIVKLKYVIGTADIFSLFNL